jgi:hypothetical protein
MDDSKSVPSFLLRKGALLRSEFKNPFAAKAALFPYPVKLIPL